MGTIASIGESRRMIEPTYLYYWRLHVRLGERYGQACRIVGRGKMNSIEIEFADATRHIVSRYSVRRRRA